MGKRAVKRILGVVLIFAMFVTILPMKQQRVMAANANRITGVKSTYNKIIGSKAFTLKAQANGAELFFTSSDAEVATVDSKTGLVTIVGMGRTVITITSQPSKKYKAASKTVILNVKPKKMQVKSAETLKQRNLTYRWEKHLGVSGYHIQLSTSPKFKAKVTKSIRIGGVNVTGCNFNKLTSRRTYYVRIRAYKTVSGNDKVYGAWSKTSRVRIK